MKISVCMASYNGAVHISRQIESILAQLGQGDELVIVDDCSSDETIEIIQGFDDRRIKLHKNRTNIGPIMTFDRVLGLAEGELVFISDQDDVWLESKVATIVNLFDTTDMDLVVHDARVTNGDQVISDSLFELIGSSPGLIRNIVSSTHTGCCMALRRTALRELLPIPAKKGIYHDSWIGVFSGCLRQKKLFLPVALIDYQRHGNNVSTMRRRSIREIIPDRFNMISAIFFRLGAKVFSNLKR